MIPLPANKRFSALIVRITGAPLLHSVIAFAPPQIGKNKQRGLLCSVFQLHSGAYFRITKLAVDHSKRMLNLGAQLSIRQLDFAVYLLPV